MTMNCTHPQHFTSTVIGQIGRDQIIAVVTNNVSTSDKVLLYNQPKYVIRCNVIDCLQL